MTAAAIPGWWSRQRLTSICAADATLIQGIQVTVKEQIKEFIKIGCEDAIREVRCNNRPLSSKRLNHHIEIAIGTGLVARVEKLAQIRGIPLINQQVERLTRRCLELEWTVDALSAAKLGVISEQTRLDLINSLVSNQLADNEEEALRLLNESE